MISTVICIYGVETAFPSRVSVIFSGRHGPTRRSADRYWLDVSPLMLISVTVRFEPSIVKGK